MSKYAPHRVSVSNPRATSSTVCQKCLGRGHYIYECKSSRPYVSRPSRTQQLEKPRILAKMRAEGKPSVEVPEEFKTKGGTANKILEAKEKERASKDEDADLRSKEFKKKKARRTSPESDSDSDSSSSSSKSDSDSDSASDSGSSSESSRSRERDRKRRVARRRTASQSDSNSGGSHRKGRK